MHLIRIIMSASVLRPSFCRPLESPVEHPYNLHIPSHWMAKTGAVMTDNVRELRPRTPDTEKITVNLGYIDLGHVDLMVAEGFYSNRTDFIRTAIRNQLERHADVVKQSTARKSVDLGLRNYSREDLEAARRAGEMLHINVLGLGDHRPGRHARAGPRHHRLGLGAGGLACHSRGQGRSRRQNEVMRC